MLEVSFLCLSLQMDTLEPTSLEVNSAKSVLTVDFGRRMKELFVPQLESGFLFKLPAEEPNLPDELSFVAEFPRFDWEAFADLLETPEFHHVNANQIDVDDTMVTLRWKNLDVEIIEFEDGSAVRIVFHDGNDDVPEVSALLTRQDVYDIAADVTRVVNQINPPLDQYPYSSRMDAVHMNPKLIVLRALAKQICDSIGFRQICGAGLGTSEQATKLVSVVGNNPKFDMVGYVALLLNPSLDPTGWFDYPLLVDLASGIQLLSRGHDDQKKWFPSQFDFEGGSTLVSLFGMTLRISMNEIRLVSFGYSEKDQAYMADTTMTRNPMNTKKAHALHLLLDEMAIELVRMKQKLNQASPQNPLFQNPGVRITLQDGWSPRPNLMIVQPYPNNSDPRTVMMNSQTRWKHLTGTVSYYTQFGFKPMVTADGRPWHVWHRDFYSKCVGPYAGPMAVKENDMDAHRKTFEECKNLTYEHGDLVEDMVKMFAPGKEVTFDGAFSLPQNIVTFAGPEDYFNRVVRKGVYPVLVTGVREYRSDAGVDEARKRPRTEVSERQDRMGL